MLIQILRGYRGERTNELFLAPGEHEVADDFAAYLVTNSHATYVTVQGRVATPAGVGFRETASENRELAAPKFDPPPDEDETPATDGLDALHFNDLRELLSAQGLTVEGTGKSGTLTKADMPAMIAALRQAAQG